MNPAVLLRYLRVPLQTTSLVLIVALSVALACLIHAGLFAVYGIVVLGFWFLKYGFALLDDVIDGRLESPLLSTEIGNPFDRRSMGLLLLIVAFYALTAKLQPAVGDMVVAALRVLFLVLIPSMVATMSVTGRVVDALNPVAVIGTICRIPVAYVTLLLIVGAIWFIPIWWVRSVGASLPNLWHKESFIPLHILSEIGLHGFIVGVLSAALFLYSWLAMFACIGGTIYERRKELDVDAAAAPERVAARVSAELERERDKTMDRVFAELRGGALGNAGDTVRRLIEKSRNPLDECCWIYARAAAADQRLAGFVAQLMMPRLIDAKATGEALRVLRERIADRPEFRPETGGQLLQLARLARDAGDRPLARRLVAGFDVHYPNDVMASEAIKLQAELIR